MLTPITERFLADDASFGVHIAYTDLYASIVFLACIYMAGMFTAQLLKMPSLVGEIVVGIILGPSLLNFVPNPEAFVLLGEIGLILLVVEAGIDIDLTTLKLIGQRGVVIALVGTFLPILMALGLAFVLGYRGVAAISAGCAFAPTSLGIAMNVLKRSGIANTPVGQLIVAAAIIDDMIALVILSQLQAFTGESVSVFDMSVPIVSAIAFLAIGGYAAIYMLPRIVDRYVLDQLPEGIDRDWMSLCIMFNFVLILIPATYYCKASPLMGAFLAGLAFCSNSGAHHLFVSQCKRPMHWLLRIFFAASIGFQVPLKLFGKGSVLIQGALFTLALLGKVVAGFLAPTFTGPRFRNNHLRDCLVIGFSMAAEGEFAFVIAAFAVSNNMISQELYASIVLAVLVSTIVAPFCLRTTISYFNSLTKESLAAEVGGVDPNSLLEEGIRDQRIAFYCIQTTTRPAWGFQAKLMEALTMLKLDVIDHRSWHPHHSNGSVLINEIYVKDSCKNMEASSKDEVAQLADGRIQEVTRVLLDSVICQTDAVIKMQRWFPESYIFSTEKKTASSLPDEDINDRIIQATSSALVDSMRGDDLGNYIRTVANGEERCNTTRPDPSGQLGGGGGLMEGRLDGLIRHGSYLR